MKALEKTLKSVSENPRYIFRLTIQGVLVGIFAGLMVCLYRFLLAGSESVLRNYLSIIHGNVLYIVLFFIALVVMALLIDWLTKWEADSAGSGIPQVNAERVISRNDGTTFPAAQIDPITGAAVTPGNTGFGQPQPQQNNAPASAPFSAPSFGGFGQAPKSDLPF